MQSPMSVVGVTTEVEFQGRHFRFDPTETLAVHCGNGFQAYQCARLNRYDAVT